MAPSDTLSDAFERGDIARVIEVWRSTRWGELGAVLCAIEAPVPNLPRGGEALAAGWADAWSRVEPWQRGTLISPLLDRAPSMNHRALKALLGFVAEQPADPRLAYALVGLGRAKSSSLSRPLVQRALVKALLVHADQASVKTLERAQNDATAADRMKIDALLKELRSGSKPPSGIGGLARAFQPPAAASPLVADQLWQAVYDAPADDTVRAVLADELQGAGDPRGAFIATQLSGDMSPPEPAIARAMLGPIAPFLVLETVRFEHGFPVEGEVGKVSTPKQKIMLNHREWATFRRVDGLTRLSPQLRSLERTGAALASGSGLEEWCKAGWSLPVKAVTIPLEQVELLRELPCHPLELSIGLSIDDVEDEQLQALFSAVGDMPSIRRLRFNEPYIGVGAEWPRWPDPETLAAAPRLKALEWDLGDQELAVERGSKGFDTIRYLRRDEDADRLLDFERAVGAKHVLLKP